MLTSVSKQRSVGQKGSKNYNGVVTLLNLLPNLAYEKDAANRVKELDLLCGSPSNGMEKIVVGGTNGKSSTIHFASKLLCEEGVKVGTVLSDHFLAFNERISINSQQICNKKFTEYAATHRDLSTERQTLEKQYCIDTEEDADPFE